MRLSGAADGRPLGFLGELHPLVASEWDLPRAAAFALDLDRVAEAARRELNFRPFAAVPALRQDVAVALPELLPASELLETVRRAGGEVLEEARVFDVYAGEQLGAGRRSVALALSFRDPERTLTEEDVAPARARIVAALEKLGGELRA